MAQQSAETLATTFKVTRSDCIQFLRSLDDDSVDLIVTDPAYSGMNQHLQLGRGRIVGEYQKAGDGDSKWFTEFHDSPESYSVFLDECRRVLRKDRHIYIMFDSFSMLSLGPIVRDYFNVKNVLVWDKVNIGMGHYFRRRHELILFASKGKRALHGRGHPDIITQKRISRARYPTQKPVKVFEAMIRPSIEPGFVVCDPFVGSGSSAIAALRAGCHFVGSDIAPEAVTMTRRRCREFLKTGDDILEPPAANDPDDGTIPLPV